MININYFTLNTIKINDLNCYYELIKRKKNRGSVNSINKEVISGWRPQSNSRAPVARRPIAKYLKVGSAGSADSSPMDMYTSAYLL